MKKLFRFLYLLIFFPIIAYADVVSLPWSTTFNCAERTVTYSSCNASNYLNVCDGFETSICYSLQSGIAAAHNFSGGGGGNGLFVQYGDGNTLSSVGPQGTGYQIDFSTPQTNFWLRWHFKFQNDMPCSSNAGFDYHKLLYIYPSSGQAAYWDDVPGAYVGGSGFRLYNQQVSQSYFVPSQVFNFEDFYDSSIADGTWHSIEVHINTSTGVFEFWAYKDNVDNATPIASFTTSWPAAIDIIKIPENAKTDFTGARNGVVYTISYDDIAISTTGRIGPISGGGDLTAPTVTTPITIATSGATLTIPFSETVTSATSGTGGFTISASGGAATLAYASGSGTSSLVYTISRTIALGETVTLTYAIPGSGARVEDTSTNTNDLAAFSGTSITNSSTQARPTLSTKTIAANGTTLTLVFNEVVTTTALTGAGGWTITPSGGAATLAYSSGSGSTSLVYTISRRIMTGETATVSYSGTYVLDATSLPLATIINSSVTNNSDSVAAFLDNLSPSGVLACSSNPRNVTLSHTTNEAATSRMTTVSSVIAYADMTDTFTTTGGISHSEVKSLACGASYNYWVRTSDAQGNVNTSSSLISFSIASPQIAGPGGIRIVGGKLTH